MQSNSVSEYSWIVSTHCSVPILCNAIESTLDRKYVRTSDSEYVPVFPSLEGTFYPVSTVHSLRLAYVHMYVDHVKVVNGLHESTFVWD